MNLFFNFGEYDLIPLCSDNVPPKNLDVSVLSDVPNEDIEDSEAKDIDKEND